MVAKHREVIKYLRPVPTSAKKSQKKEVTVQPAAASTHWQPYYALLLQYVSPFTPGTYYYYYYYY